MRRDVSVGLLLTLALQSAVAPFATDMYAPSFPAVTASLATTSTMVGFTLTAFFVGMGVGQILGGVVSDRLGRRGPLLVGGLICTAGGVACVLAPTIGWLILGRVFQGLGGGATAAIARAVAVDRVRGDKLARILTLLGAIGGVAPMVAPVLGGVIASVASWRVVFWCLAGLGLAMTISAWAVVSESLPPERRHGSTTSREPRAGGLANGQFVGYLLINCFSGAAMFAYIADSSFVLQGIIGLTPLAFALVFAANAGISMGLSFLNSAMVGRHRPRNLIRVGLLISSAGVALLAVSVFAFGTTLAPTWAGFVLLISGQSFVFGNSSALALEPVRRMAGTASAVMGLTGALVNSVVAPVSSIGGVTSAVPMAIVMLVGAAGAWLTFALVGRAKHGHSLNDGDAGHLGA